MKFLLKILSFFSSLVIGLKVLMVIAQKTVGLELPLMEKFHLAIALIIILSGGLIVVRRWMGKIGWILFAGGLFLPGIITFALVVRRNAPEGVMSASLTANQDFLGLVMFVVLSLFTIRALTKE